MHPENIERKLEILLGDEGIVFVHSAFSFIDANGRVLNPKASWWDSRSSLDTPEEFVRGTLENGLRVDLSRPLMQRRAISDEHFGKVRASQRITASSCDWGGRGKWRTSTSR